MLKYLGTVLLLAAAGMLRADNPKVENEKYLFSDPPVIQAQCQGEEILRFGNTWIWQQAPNLQQAESLQKNNQDPLIKIRPKKSSALQCNFLGVNTSGMPRSRQNDYQPLEVVHLIDGDPSTCWLSRGTRRPEVALPFVRIDFPLEQEIEKVVLKKRIIQYERPNFTKIPVYHAAEVGRALPLEILIEGCRDGYQWQTLYKGPTGDTPDKNEWFVNFAPTKVKAVRVTGLKTVNTENFGYSFSVSELEIFDRNQKNVALISRGTGIVGSGTERGRNELTVMRDLWPVHHESGFKWARIGYHDDPINWHEVEKEKGVLRVDPFTDQAITEFANQGINIIMCLNFGNRLYTMPDLMKGAPVNDPRKRPFPQLWEWYYDLPAPPVTEEALKAWDRYIEFMAVKYRNRVKYFEIWNEWNISLYWGAEVNVDHYLALAKRTIPILRRLAPNVKIMAGSTSGFPFECRNWSPKIWKEMEKTNARIRSWKELMPLVDAIGWHPYYQPKPDQLTGYPEDVRALKKWACSLGFKGMFMSSEWNMSYNWPDFLPEDAKVTWQGNNKATEMEKAKYVVQCFTQDAGLELISCFCEMNQPFYGALDLSLLRRSIDSEYGSVLQPEAAFYMARNLATMLDRFKPAEFPREIVFTDPVAAKDFDLKKLRSYSFTTPTGRALAIWFGGKAKDVTVRCPMTVTVPGEVKSALAMDPINGVSQKLALKTSQLTSAPDNQKEQASPKKMTVLKDIMICDCPLILLLNQ